MIYLDESNFIGKGKHRECYRHPEDGSLCVKVDISRNGSDMKREKKYYKHLLKRGISWEMLPQYHGGVETNLGTGSVFDLIQDDNGNVSQTLQHYLSSIEMLQIHSESLSVSLRSLKDYILKQGIVTMSLKPKNIACRDLGKNGFRLYIIDNIGNSDLIPISNFFTFLAARKMQRKWIRFENNMLREYKHKIKIQQMIERSNQAR